MRCRRVTAVNRREQEAGVSERDHTYKVVEITGSSAQGVTEAIQSGVSRAAETLRHLEWVEVDSIRGRIEEGKVAYFQVTMKLGFRLED
jgi:flavin-binding protein dodecin